MTSKIRQLLRETANEREFVPLVMLITVIPLFYAAMFVVNKLILIGHYGLERVRADGLYVAEMPRGKDWIVVSNGDIVTNVGGLYILFVWACLVATMVPVVWLAQFISRRLWPQSDALPKV